MARRPRVYVWIRLLVLKSFVTNSELGHSPTHNNASNRGLSDWFYASQMKGLSAHCR